MNKGVKKYIIEVLDNAYQELEDNDFMLFDENLSDEDTDEIESTFMSARNLIAGFEWDGERREYETYNIKD